MRNTSQTAWFLTSTVLLTVVFILSCVTLQHVPDFSKPLSQRKQAPVDAFVLVEVTLDAQPADCVSKNKEINCDKLLKSLPPIHQKGTGSGLLVESDMGPVILTAAHVCEVETPDSFIHDGVTISILSMIKYEVRSPIYGSHTATIARIDTKKDLCLLRIENVFTYPVSIAEDPPTIGDRVYSVAAPYGISGSNLALVFSGFYSGSSRGLEYYTIPTRPGSSGAAVLNEQWEVVGVLQLAFRNLENVGMGRGLKAIKSFLFSPVSVTVEHDDSSL